MKKTKLNKNMICGILLVFMLVTPTSIASTLSVNNSIKGSDKTAADTNGLPDLIIEDIYSEITWDITYYHLTIRNIGDSDTVGDLDLKVDYIVEMKIFGIPIKIPHQAKSSTGGGGAIVPPGGTHDIAFIKDVNHEYRNCKISFSAEINYRHRMKESNYDNNFYSEVINSYYKTRIK